MWLEVASRSTLKAFTLMGTLPKVCTASVWNMTRCSLHTAPISTMGWMVPISLLPWMTDTSVVSGRMAASTSAGSKKPSASTGRRVTS